MIDQHNLSELEEMILLGFREQAIHPQGLNSSHTHGMRFPAGTLTHKLYTGIWISLTKTQNNAHINKLTCKVTVSRQQMITEFWT